MKKIIISSAILFCSILSFSQDKKLKNGTYSAYNSDKILNVLIQDEKLFLYVYPFEYSLKNDSILTMKNQKPPGFSLTLSFDKTVDFNKIKVNVINYLFSVNDFFIATEAEKAKSDFKSLSKIRKNLSIDGNVEVETDLTSFEIEKTKNITLVKEDNYQKTGEIATFEIPDNINTINIDYQDKNDPLQNITGIFSQKNNDLTLYNDGKEPLKFKYNKEIILADIIKPKETVIKKNWTYPGKTPIYSEESTEMEVDTAAVKIEAEKTVAFKHFRSKNFKEALKHTSITPEKFLVVSFDLKDNKRQSKFDNYIEESEIVLSEYYDSEETKNQFDYYLATEKDKNLLSKYKIKSDSEILVFNSKGDLIYHTPENLPFNKTLFWTYESAYSELGKAHLELEFDKVMLNKKATTKEILRMLSIAPSLEIKVLSSENLTVDGVKFVKPTVVDMEPVFDPVKTDPDYTTTGQPMTDEERKTLSETFPPPKLNDSVIDTTAEAQNYTDYYSIIKNKENLYRLKSTLKTVNEKWEKIVVEYEKSNKIDEDYITVIKQELNDEGFSKKIFDASSFKIEDYRMLNYVFANYKSLIKEYETKDNPVISNEHMDAAQKAVDEAARMAARAAEDAIKPYNEQYSQGINDVLDNYFSRFANEVDLKDKDVKNQKNIKFLLFEYYKKYVQITDYNTGVVRNYMNVLDDNLADPEYKKEYFEIFEIYFNKMIAPNKSSIESLDTNFSENYEDNWVDYKNSFANSCNLIAWEIVKNSTDKTLIQKAIKWSETSVEIEKKSHWYYDTLARLYYLNNQKEKAIATQQIAIDLGGNSEYGDDYRNVIQEMKKGNPLPSIKE